MRQLLQAFTILTVSSAGSLANANFLRDLQEIAIEVPTEATSFQQTSAVPKFYEDTTKIAYSSSLGCGACIRGGYVYCIPGAEGSDPATWGKKTATCCSSNTCTQAKDKTYSCSTLYSDATQAKALCPFKTASCGSSSAFNFTAVGQTQNISIKLSQGESCTYLIEANCGLPTIAPNDTTGFEIETLDYDDEDLSASMRMLQGGSYATSKAIQKLAKNALIKRNVNRTSNNATEAINGTKVAEKIVGTIAKKYNPSADGAAQKFKGGLMNGLNDTICKKRYSQVTVTALGTLATSGTRILQSSSSEYEMTMTMGTSDFETAPQVLTEQPDDTTSFALMTEAFSALLITLCIFLY